MRLRTRFLALVWLAVLHAEAASAAGHIIAVLPLDTRMTKGKMDEAAQASLEEMLRDTAVEALGEGWTVLTGETTLQILRDNGVDPTKCGDQNCHLSMAREIKAERFLSGAIQYAEGDFTASFRLIDATTGRILASERVEGSSTKALRAAFTPKAAQFFARAGGVAADTGGGNSKPPVPGGSTEAKIASEPAGATVRIDGEVVGKTPLRKALPPGSYYVTLESDGFAPVTRQFEVEAGKPATFFAQLLKNAGYLDLSVTPGSARVTIDGTQVGSGKQGPFAIGTRALHAEAPGYAPIDRPVQVENGITSPLSITLSPLPGKVLVSVNVEADCQSSGVHATATPSSIGVLAVPAGNATVTCRREGFGSATQSVTVEPGKTVAITMNIPRQLAPGDVRTGEKGGLEFVYLPGGSFHLGCEPGDTKCFADEKPGRQASVGPFWMGKTEVTAAAYTACVNAGACKAASDNPADICNYKSDRTSHPINCIDWEQARAVCTWMGARLPTVDEWEFAAKSGEARVYPWVGKTIDGTRANVCDQNCTKASAAKDADWADASINDGFSATSPVGAFPAGATRWGLLDMVGNVWEWTSSDYAAGQKEFRGAGWYDTPLRARTSHRLGGKPDLTAINLGVRCALSQ